MRFGFKNSFLGDFGFSGPSVPAIVYEPETIAYMEAIAIPNDATIYYASTAFQITGMAIWSAVQSFVLSLKSTLGLTLGVNNLSTKIDAIYPFIGGTSATHKFNLCNPIDSNLAFRLLFSGGWTHGATGVTPNGINGYANTFWDSLTYATSTKISYGGYNRNLATLGLHGTWDLTNPTRLYDSAASGGWTIGSTGGIGYGSPISRFHAIAVRASGTKSFNDGAVATNAGVLSYTPINKPFYIGARNNNNASINNYADTNLAFYYLTGKVELTDTNVIDLSTAVTQLQTALFRNV